MDCREISRAGSGRVVPLVLSRLVVAVSTVPVLPTLRLSWPLARRSAGVPKGLYDICPRAAESFLDAETEGGMQGMREMLLHSPDRPVRMAMRGFYLHLFGILAEAEGDR